MSSQTTYVAADRSAEQALGTRATDHDSTLDAAAVRAALGEGPHPGLSRDLVSFGMVRHFSTRGTQAKVQLAFERSSIESFSPGDVRGWLPLRTGHP